MDRARFGYGTTGSLKHEDSRRNENLPGKRSSDRYEECSRYRGILGAVARFPGVQTRCEIKQLSLAVTEQRKGVRHNCWARVRIFWRGNWSRAQFRSHQVNGVSSVIQSRSARATLPATFPKAASMAVLEFASPLKEKARLLNGSQIRPSGSLSVGASPSTLSEARSKIVELEARPLVLKPLLNSSAKAMPWTPWVSGMWPMILP